MIFNSRKDIQALGLPLKEEMAGQYNIVNWKNEGGCKKLNINEYLYLNVCLYASTMAAVLLEKTYSCMKRQVNMLT